MVLQISDLKKSNVVSGANVDEAVLEAIVKTANNFYDPVIRTKQGEAYGNIDKAMTEAGYKKNPGEQTSAFVVRVANELKSSGGSEKLAKERDELKTKVADLEAKIEAGAGGAALKGKVEELQKQITQKETDIEALKTHHSEEKTALEKRISSLSERTVSNAFDNAANSFFSQVTFDPKLSGPMLKLAKNDIMNQVKEKGSLGLDEGGNLVFTDNDGNVMKNAANNLEPFRFEDFAKTVSKDYIVEGGTSGGGGTGKVKPGAGGGAGSFSLQGIKSKTEATAAIQRHLAEEGIPAGTEEYQTKYSELYSTEGVEDLPLVAE